MPAKLYRAIPFADLYPNAIGGTDTFMSRSVLEQGGRLGYIENGPVARHNDWPYSEAKIRLYAHSVRKRTVLDRHYLRWKLRYWCNKLRGG
jgi:hypothetical protein